MNPVLSPGNETAWLVLCYGVSTGSCSWALTASMALCVEQGPAYQPGCGEVLQAAQLHGQQTHHLALHAGLLHVPVLPQVRTHPGPAFTPLMLFFEAWHPCYNSSEELLYMWVSGLCSPKGVLPWGCWSVPCWPPDLCESQER